MNNVIECPTCGAATEVDLEGDLESAETGEHSFVQDCDVCCAPIAIRVRIGADGSLALSYERA
jgi:hypothetical protein